MEGFQLETRNETTFYIQTNMWDKGFTVSDLGEAVFAQLKHDAYVIWEDRDTGMVQIAPLKK